MKLKVLPSHDCFFIEAINDYPLTQDDPCVLNIIGQEFLKGSSDQPMSINHPEIKNPSMGIAQTIVELLNGEKYGSFVEYGAGDGETRSNTLYLERALEWEGILIEPDKQLFEQLLDKNRHVWAISTCLSTTTKPQ